MINEESVRGFNPWRRARCPFHIYISFKNAVERLKRFFRLH